MQYRVTIPYVVSEERLIEACCPTTAVRLVEEGEGTLLVAAVVEPVDALPPDQWRVEEAGEQRE